MKMQKILSMSTPLIHHTPPIDSILSILGSNYEVTKSSIFNNLTEFWCSKENPEEHPPWVDFTTITNGDKFSHLLMANLPRELLIGDVVTHVLNALNNDYYSFFYTDTFYIKPYVNYLKYHTIHEVLIYGYDLEEEVFYGADFFDYTHYDRKMVRFSELREAYNNFPDLHIEDYLNGIAHYKLQAAVNSEFDILKFYIDLQSLVSSRIYDNGSKLLLYGFQYFGILREYLKQDNFKNFSPKSFNFIYSHTVIMKLRLEYVFELYPQFHKDIIGEITKISEFAHIILNYSIKVFILRREDTFIQEAQITKLIDYINIIENEYVRFIRKLISIVETLM